MRHFVVTPLYLMRKALDDLLYKISCTQTSALSRLMPLLSQSPYTSEEPRSWLPLYTMVTFRPDLNYAMVKRKASRQSTILSAAGLISTAFLGVAVFWAARMTRSQRLHS